MARRVKEMKLLSALTKWIDHWKVRHKLLGIFLIVTAIPILIAGAYLNYSTREIVLDNSLREANASMEKLQGNLEVMLSRMISISDMIFLSPELRQLLQNDYESPLDMYNAYQRYPVFRDYLKYYDEIETIQFFMTKEMITNSQFIYANEQIRRKDWYIGALEREGRIFWDYKEEHWTGESFLALNRAIYGHGDELLGVLVIYISKDKLKALMSGQPHNVFFTLDHHTILYNKDAEYLGSEASFLPNNPNMEDHIVLDGDFEEDAVKINVHSFQLDKSLENTFQVSAILQLDQIMEKPNEVFQRGFLTIVAIFTVSLLLISIFIRNFHLRVQYLHKAMVQVARGDFNITYHVKGNDEISNAFQDLKETSKSIQKMIDEVYVHKIKEEKWKRKQKEMDFKMLASQINPHFLYNTLEMIRMKALMNKDPEVAQLVKMLSKMMRSSLERTDRLIPIKKEMELIDYYLNIQQMRFGDKFSYQVNVDPPLENYYILPLILQPLVENAIIHGLESKENHGFIRITLKEHRDFIDIEVMDNGTGIPREKYLEIKERMDDGTYQSEGNRIGLHNVQQRMKLYYGEDYGLRIDSIHGLGTTVLMKLPKMEHEH